MWACYVIGRADSAHTYCGMTNNFPRRLRQHNGEIAGGARATAARGSGWVPLLRIEGFADKREALRAEWRLHHPAGSRRSRPRGGPAGRAAGLRSILEPRDARWTRQSPAPIGAAPLRIVVLDARVGPVLTEALRARYPALTEEHAWRSGSPGASSTSCAAPDSAPPETPAPPPSTPSRTSAT